MERKGTYALVDILIGVSSPFFLPEPCTSPLPSAQGKLSDSFSDVVGDSSDKVSASSVASGASSNHFRCMGPSPAMANESFETVTALLRKPSEELTLDDIEFLLNCVRKAPALALQPPFATHNVDEDELAASSQDGTAEIMDDQSD